MFKKTIVVPFMCFFLTSCIEESKNGSSTDVLEQPSTFPYPSKIVQSKNIVLSNLRPILTVSGKDVSMDEEQGTWSATVQVPLDTSVVVSIVWHEQFQGVLLGLADQTQEIYAEQSEQVINFSPDDYYSDKERYDYDSDGISNLEERTKGSDPTVNENPTSNTPPTANIAGGPSIVRNATDVNSNGEDYARFTLDGSGSSDSKTASNDLIYEWSCVDGDVQGRESTYTRNFTVGQCDWKLKVTDEQGASDVATIDVTVNPIPVTNSAPVAVISGGGRIERDATAVNSNGVEYARFTLDGSGSYDNESAKSNLKYEWSCAGGGVLGTESTYTRNFTVGQCDWRLKVIDPQGESSVDTVDVIVNPKPNVGVAVFRESYYSFAEGDGRVKLNIDRVNGSDGTLRMWFRTPGVGNGADAEYRVDFNPIDGNDDITLSNGETSAGITFDIVDDGISEGTEEVYIELWSGHEGESGSSFITRTHMDIGDND